MVAENIAALLGIDLTHVVCVHGLGKSAPLRMGYDYRWNDRMRGRLDALLEMTEPATLGFNSTRPGQEYPHAIIDMSTEAPYHFHYIEWRAGFRDLAGTVPNYFTLLVELLSRANQLSDALYGLVTHMPISSLPCYYFMADADVPDMTTEEDENLNSWYEQREDYWSKVRGVYWGNLLSVTHLEPLGGAAKFSHDVAVIVGSNLVARIDADKVFFMLPDLADSRLAVEHLFSRAGLLMHAKSEDRDSI